MRHRRMMDLYERWIWYRRFADDSQMYRRASPQHFACPFSPGQLSNWKRRRPADRYSRRILRVMREWRLGQMMAQ
jgi:hypothetical protein